MPLRCAVKLLADVLVAKLQMLYLLLLCKTCYWLWWPYGRWCTVAFVDLSDKLYTYGMTTIDLLFCTVSLLGSAFSCFGVNICLFTFLMLQSG